MPASLTRHVRRVGGALMMSIPPSVTRELSLSPATTMRMVVEKGQLIVTPCERPPKHSLQQLVAGTDFSGRDAAWLDGGPEGDELI